MANSIWDKLTGNMPPAQPRVQQPRRGPDLPPAQTPIEQDRGRARPPRQSRQPNVQRLTPEQRQGKLQELRRGSLITPDSPGPGMPAAIPQTVAGSDALGPGQNRMIQTVEELHQTMPPPRMPQGNPGRQHNWPAAQGQPGVAGYMNPNRNAWIAHQTVGGQGAQVQNNVGRFTTRQPVLPAGIQPQQVQAPPGTNQGQLLPPGVQMPYFGSTEADRQQAQQQMATYQTLAAAPQGQQMYAAYQQANAPSLSRTPAGSQGEILNQMQAEQYGRVPAMGIDPAAPVAQQAQMGPGMLSAGVNQGPVMPAQQAPMPPADPRQALVQNANLVYGEPGVQGLPMFAQAGGQPPPTAPVTAPSAPAPDMPATNPFSAEIAGTWQPLQQSGPTVLHGQGPEDPNAMHSPTFSVIDMSQGGPAIAPQNTYDPVLGIIQDRDFTPADRPTFGRQQYSPGGPIFTGVDTSGASEEWRNHPQRRRVMDARAAQLAQIEAQREAQRMEGLPRWRYEAERDYAAEMAQTAAQNAATAQRADEAQQRLAFDQASRFSDQAIRQQQADAAQLQAEAAMYKAENPNRPQRPMPTRVSDALYDMSGTLSTTKRLADTFQDAYAKGYLTDASNYLQNVFGVGEDGQGLWWKQLAEMNNLVRNQLFGSALTKTEQAAFEKATITNEMDADQIRLNLAKQQFILMTGLRRRATQYINAGYNPQEVSSLLDINEEEIMNTTPESYKAGLISRGFSEQEAAVVTGVVDEDRYNREFGSQGPQTGAQQQTGAPSLRLTPPDRAGLELWINEWKSNPANQGKDRETFYDELQDEMGRRGINPEDL